MVQLPGQPVVVDNVVRDDDAAMEIDSQLLQPGQVEGEVEGDTVEDVETEKEKVSSPAQQHLQQVQVVWRTVDMYLNGGGQSSRCIFIPDPSIIGLCHRALKAAFPSLNGPLQPAHLTALNEICSAWLGSCKMWNFAPNQVSQKRVLRVMVQRPSTSTLCFSLRAIDDWEMSDVDVCRAIHPYPRGALWTVSQREHNRERKRERERDSLRSRLSVLRSCDVVSGQAQFDQHHLGELYRVNVSEWFKCVHAVSIFNNSSYLASMVSCQELAESDHPDCGAIEKVWREEHFPWYHDGPCTSTADPYQFFVQLDGLVQYEAIETFERRRDEAIEVPLALLCPLGAGEPVPYVPLSVKVLQVMFGWTTAEASTMYGRIRGACRPDRNGSLAHLYIESSASNTEMAKARVTYQRDLAIQLPATTGWMPLLDLTRLCRTIYEKTLR